jgi:putative two-component system response regulator
MVEMCAKKRNITELIESLPSTVIGHMYRVGLLASILTGKILESNSVRLRCCETELSNYGKCAFFHDIGKAFIPVNILIKSGRFTAEEMGIMKNHTLCAQVLLDDVERGLINGLPELYVGLVRAAAVYHHEWWNGKGYPYGIDHEQIPLIARITSVCDAYDAITSKRCYKAAHSHLDACRELEAFSGTQFDPTLVRLFLDNEADFSALIRINRGLYPIPLID